MARKRDTDYWKQQYTRRKEREQERGFTSPSQATRTRRQGIIYKHGDYDKLGMEKWGRQKEEKQEGVAWDIIRKPYTREASARQEAERLRKDDPVMYAHGNEKAEWGLIEVRKDEMGNWEVHARVVVRSGHGESPKKRKGKRRRRR